MLLKPGSGKSHPYIRRRAIQRSLCPLPTEVPGRNRTQPRIQASLDVPSSEARLAIGFLVIDISGPAADESEFEASLMRQLRRPIRLSSGQMSRCKVRTKSRKTHPPRWHIAKERFAGWWIFGSTLQLPLSVGNLCPPKRPKVRYISYGTVCRFLAARTRKIQKICHDSYLYLLVQQIN